MMRQRARRSRSNAIGHAALRGATNGSIVPVPKSLNRLAGIAQEVPSIGDLDSTRGTLADTVGIGARTIAGDDLDAGPTMQPGS